MASVVENSLEIVHVTSYQVPGYGYEELPLAQAQHRLGHRVAILTSNYLYPSGPYAVLRNRFPSRRVAPVTEEQEGVSIVRLQAVEGPGRRVWIRGLEREIRQRQPQIVHCHNLLQFHSVRVALLRALRGTPYGLVIDDHMHESVVRRSVAGRLFYSIYRTLHPLLASQVGAFCAISEETKQYLTKRCGIRRDIEVRSLGVDTSLFKRSARARAEWRSRLSLGPSRLVFLYTGKVVAAKGVDVLISAALRLAPRFPSLSVVVVGDSDERYIAEARRRITTAGLDDRFRFLPAQTQEELAALYSAADVAVWPRQESRALYEALSCSLPVIVSSGTGYASLVNEGLGLTFGPGDDDLDRAMVELASPVPRAKCGSRGRGLMEREYSWDRCAVRYLSTYRRVLGQSEVPSRAVVSEVDIPPAT